MQHGRGVAIVVAATAAVALGQGASPTPFPCATALRNVRTGQVGATWDLSALYNSQLDYNWIDSDDALTINSTYVFNICGNVNNVPGNCINGPSPAYQVTKDRNGNPTNCYRLGTDLKNGGSITWSLIDFFNPAEGISLTYRGGDADFCSYARSLTVNFHCSHNTSQTFPPPGINPPPTNSFFTWMDEVNMCQYIANSYSSIGCPNECPSVGGQVCGGNGVCGWDSGLLTARCFCNDDWIESDCTTPRTPFPTGAVAGSVFGGLVLGALGAVVFVVVLQRRGAGGARSAGSAAGAPVEGFYA